MKVNMKLCISAFAWLITVASAEAETSLQDMLNEASSCSDASLQIYATRTCDPPEQVAKLAFAACQRQWSAVANKAIEPPDVQAPDYVSMRYKRSLKMWSDAMENEYERVAELKAIDIRTDARRCGFE